MADHGHAALASAVIALNEKVATVHERVACPACGMPVGQPCVHARTWAPIKHAHRERLRADGIALR